MIDQKSKIKDQKAMDSCPPERSGLNEVKELACLTGVKLKSMASALILYSSLFIFLLLIFHSEALAEGISLGVYPPIIQINATPPAEVLSPVTIENRGDFALNLKVNFKPFVPSDREDGQIRYVKEEEANLSDPLFLQKVKILDESGQTLNELALFPKQQRKLTLSVSIPKDSLSSDYYFSIIFLSSSSGQNITSSENVSGIASNVLLSIGEGKVSGEIAEFSAPIFIEKGPVPFTLRVKNTSNHFIAPKGEVLIKNLFGQTIGRVDLAQVNILANSVRNIPSEEFLNNEKNLGGELAAYWPEKFILGPYKATLSVALSDSGPLFRRSILFFAFPVKALAAVIIGIMLLIYISLKVKRSLRA